MKAGFDNLTSLRIQLFLKSNVRPAFELENLTGFVRRCRIESELAEDLPGLPDLFCVRCCEAALVDPQAIFQTDAHVAAEHRGLPGQCHLMPPGANDRPLIVAAKETVGHAPHVVDVLVMRADAPADAEHRLDEQRRSHEA